MKNETWVERREFTLRSAGNLVSGYAALYDSLSEDLGGFVEVIKPGAFAGVLHDDVRALINHEGIPLARTKSGTLRLRDDGRGLLMEFQFSEATFAQDLRIAMSRGDITQCSFSFDVGDDRVGYRNGVLLREILSFKRLYDVSIVTYPAYPETTVGLREGAKGEAWRAQHLRRKFELDVLKFAI
jgi:HK97 family phage prohead protease